MAKRKKKQYPSAATAEPFNCPAVSVVIPMYNAEKFISECLESILAQSFKNFELIVVDDASTDNSPAIVDSFIPKFGGRLNHFHLKENSGGNPRNIGITLARGEYIRFVDADDRIVDTALEEDFNLAKEYDADVLYHTLFYDLSADGTENKLSAVPKYQPGDEIILDNDLSTRVNDIARNKYRYELWRSFSRRDFLIANELYFPDICPYDWDIVWSNALLIYAEKFLLVPTAVYYHRDKNTKFYPNLLGLKNLDAFISRNKFFETKPQLHYALLENYLNEQFKLLFENSSELSSFTLYETLKEEFGSKLGDYDVLIPALCSVLAQQQQLAAMNINQFKNYAAQAEKRIIALENEIHLRKNKG